jgi:GTPase SAR1 family protein
MAAGPYTSPLEVKVVLLGESGVGKSSMAARFVFGRLTGPGEGGTGYAPTIG